MTYRDILRCVEVLEGQEIPDDFEYSDALFYEPIMRRADDGPGGSARGLRIWFSQLVES